MVRSFTCGWDDSKYVLYISNIPSIAYYACKIILLIAIVTGNKRGKPSIYTIFRYLHHQLHCYPALQMKCHPRSATSWKKEIYRNYYKMETLCRKFSAHSPFAKPPPCHAFGRSRKSWAAQIWSLGWGKTASRRQKEYKESSSCRHIIIAVTLFTEQSVLQGLSVDSIYH